MKLENPPTLASELTSLPVTSWRRFARDLHDGRIERICILSDVERVKCEAEEWKQLVAEGVDTLSGKSKKERFDEQSWDSLKSSPFYEVLREYRDVLPDDISAESPQDKDVQHDIDLVPGTRYCVTRSGHCRKSKSKRSTTFEEVVARLGNAGIEVPAQRAYVLCQEGTGRVTHRSRLQQVERRNGTGADVVERALRNYSLGLGQHTRRHFIHCTPRVVRRIPGVLTSVISWDGVVGLRRKCLQRMTSAWKPSHERRVFQVEMSLQ
ncbi:hypothetical protein PF003_g38490 [Phytophthora fragariae]|nr:hypothetical protein PF003_g38490 [Phytophthora fragariae]